MINLQITLLCDNPNSWMVPYIHTLFHIFQTSDHVQLVFVTNPQDIPHGDLAFFLSCEQIISKELLRRNAHNLVIHASDLPKGRGWSPLTWQIIEGKNYIPITLFEAGEKVDSGDIYLQKVMEFQGHELLDELHQKLGAYTIALVLDFIAQYPNITKRAQQGTETYYSRRTPCDSELDPSCSLNELFPLLRTVDNERYPAFFYKNGKKYILKIYSAD
jgi:methionyl-tRNA formyltransferase